MEDTRSHHRKDRWTLSRDIEGKWLHRNALDIAEPEPDESGEKQQAVDELLSMLTEQQRDAVELVLLQGLTYDAAAQLLDTTSESVRKRVSRAKRRMVEGGEHIASRLYD
jgi:RNA polymerase sigma factor (sigma-70 family)